MNSRNTTYDHNWIHNWIIGIAILDDKGPSKGRVVVEHYCAEDVFHCMKQCLEAHGVFVHHNIDTVERLMTLADHNNILISFPRKVTMTLS